jgi:hypothetical protein
LKTVIYILALLVTNAAIADGPEFFTPDPEQPGLYVARPMTLVHTVRPNRRDDWLKKFYEEYKRTGKPPAEWFTFKDGVWVGAMERVNVSSVDYDTLYANGFFRQRTKNSILFAANPKPAARWLNIQDPKSMALWQAWSADPENLAKPNRFFGLKKVYDISPDPKIVWHSAFYDELNLVGIIKNSQVDIIVRNDRMLADSKVFVPRFMNIMPPKTIYFKNCGEMFQAAGIP